MHRLMRRVAMGLALPLVVGAPVVLVAGPAHAADLTLTSITTPSSALYGQPVQASATVTDQELQPIADGSVQFGYRPPGYSGEPIAIGAPVPLSPAGTAVSPILATNDGTPFEVTIGSDFYQVTADFIPSGEEWATSGDSDILSISKSGTSIAVLPTATTLVADMAGALPGGAQAHSLKPSGAVAFTVNGTPVGSNNIVNGKATLNYVLPAGNQTVTATYAGDDRYGPATQSLTRVDPTLDARVFSRFPKSKSGWYHSSVRVWFFCKPRGSELIEGCPSDVTLKQSGKGQGLTRAVHAVDGGFATTTVSDIDIDRDLPEITVNGRTCTATDKLSGVKGKCQMKIEPNGHYRAIAKDKAGNRAVEHGVLD